MKNLRFLRVKELPLHLSIDKKPPWAAGLKLKLKMQIKRNNIVFLGIFSFLMLLLSSCGNSMQEAEHLYKAGVSAAKSPDSLNEAGKMLLKSLSLQDEDKPTELLVKTYEHISRVYWEQDYPDKALSYAKKSLKAMENIDNDSLLISVYNRVASSYYLSNLKNRHDSATLYYNKTLGLAIATNDAKHTINAYNNLGAVLISQGKPDEALEMFERSHKVPNQRKKDHATYYYNRSRCFENKNMWDSCIVAIRKSLAYHDSTDFEARGKLYRRLYKAEKHLNHLDHACLYVDSAMKFTDKSLAERQRDDLKNVTERYQQEKYESDLRLQRTHWLVVLLAVIVVFALLFVGQMFRNKQKMIGLQRRMEALNLRVVREEQVKKQASTKAMEHTANQADTTDPVPALQGRVGEETEWTEEKEENLSQLYLEQFKVSREIFQARPAYSKIRQLKYHTDKNYLPDEERLPLIDSILEVFIDQLQKLVATYPELTEDECIYALLIFIGCNNATASIITKTSEATLRKRRSRFKQKTNEQVFQLFMGA